MYLLYGVVATPHTQYKLEQIVKKQKYNPGKKENIKIVTAANVTINWIFKLNVWYGI